MTPLLMMMFGSGPVPCDSSRFADRLRECVSMNDPAPFLRSPRLELIGACRDTGSDPNCGKPSATAWKHTFHRAARFSVPRYGQHRQPIDADGLLIYEGMTLSVDPETGVYDLNFTATSPPTPVTLRLQLQFVKSVFRLASSGFRA